VLHRIIFITAQAQNVFPQRESKRWRWRDLPTARLITHDPEWLTRFHASFQFADVRSLI